MCAHIMLTIVMLSKLRCHAHFLFSATQITWSRLLTQIHILNDKQCRWFGSRGHPRGRFERKSLLRLADFSLSWAEGKVKMYRMYREIQNLDQNFSLKSWNCRKTSPSLKALGWPCGSTVEPPLTVTSVEPSPPINGHFHSPPPTPRCFPIYFTSDKRSPPSSGQRP